jgi:hypothetical protein
MKKKDNYFLDKHKKWMEAGRLDDGLCESFRKAPNKYKSVLDILTPTENEQVRLIGTGFSGMYWASGTEYWERNRYTPLRQTIVLFCHEILNSTP